MKKLLIITYYWPPSGGAGVQRWLKFVKYLREFGWELVVYTPSNPENPVEDRSLEKDIPHGIEILKTKIWEPYDLYKKFVGRKPHEKINTGFLTEKKKTRLTEKLSVWLRGNLFIPDARKFWIKSSINFLSEYLSKQKIDVIASTGPPHSMHLIALGLKKKFQIPWLADFRDPWTNIDYYKDLMLTAWADKKHQRLEKQVLQNADSVISIGNTLSEELIGCLSSNEGSQMKKFHVITNGYDEDDIVRNAVVPDKKFSIAHIGTLVKTRNPETLWKVLSELIRENEKFKIDLEIKLAGKVDVTVMTSIENNQLKNHLNRIKYLNHDEVIKVQQQSQVLLLVLNNTPNSKGILTGKIFEYIAAKRPILCIGPPGGDAAEIISECNAGTVVNFDEEQKLKTELLRLYNLYLRNMLFSDSMNIEKYSRKSLTKKLADVLNSMIKLH